MTRYSAEYSEEGAEKSSPSGGNDSTSSAARRSRSVSGLDIQVIVAIMLIIGGSMAGLGYWLNAYHRATEIRNAVDSNAFYMNVLLEPLLRGVPREGTVPAELETELDDMLAQGFRGRPIETAVIWWRDATVSYSTDKSIMGQQITSSHLDAAFGGKVVARLIEDLTGHGQHRQEQLGQPLLEVYVPLRDPETGTIDAVGEFYQIATHLKAQIDRAAFVIWGTIGLTTVLMLALLLVTVTRARAVVSLHRRELNDKLEESQRLARQNDALRKAAERARVDAFKMNEELLNQIGSDIHDGPLQLLSLVTLRLDGLQLGREDRSEDPAERAKTIELAMQTTQELRDLAVGLAIPELEPLTVEEALRLAISRHENRTDTVVATKFGDLPVEIATPLKMCLYRIVQEALNNAFWHAGGVGQEVAATAWNGQIEIVVKDGGPGMASPVDASRSGGLGLPGLVRRLQAFSGTLQIESQPGAGTVVTARLPIGDLPAPAA